MIYLSENTSNAIFGIGLILFTLWVIFEFMKDGNRKESKKDS